MPLISDAQAEVRGRNQSLLNFRSHTNLIPFIVRLLEAATPPAVMKPFVELPSVFLWFDFQAV